MIRRLLLIVATVLSLAAPVLVFAQAPAPTPTKVYPTPQLEVPIPNLSFTAPLEANGLLTSNFLAEYVSGMYKFLISISVVVAIIFVMIGGLQYTLAGASGETAKAKQRIRNAVTGLVLLLSAYLILYTVNPNLTLFRAFEIVSIPRQALDEDITRNLQACPDVKDTVKKCTATTLGSVGFAASLVTTINEVAASTGVDPILIATHIQKETRGNLNYSGQIGPCGEFGIAQFMPTTFESVTGQTECCTAAASENGVSSAKAAMCNNNTTTEWPPPAALIPKCDIGEGCKSCQVASASCIAYFDTSQPNGVKNTVTATAQLISYNLRKTNDDIAMAMCAYNGAGKHAAEYAASAATIYADFCTKSGGTQP